MNEQSKAVRKKTNEQLKKELNQKVFWIKKMLSQAFDCKCGSDERTEYSNNIATSLRAIIFGDKSNDYKSLIHRVGLDKKLLFPLYYGRSCVNVFPTYNLLDFKISNEGIEVSINSDLFLTGGFWGCYMTYESWLNEVVIDTKLKTVEPLSRLLIIKIISDTIGAHVDTNIEEHIFNMSKHRLLPIVIQNGVEKKKDIEIETKAIICETILAIAKEFVDSYEMFTRVNPKLLGFSNDEIRMQKYHSNKNYELIKYGLVPKDSKIMINVYNSNSFFECDIFSKVAPLYELTFNHRLFRYSLIDYKEVLKGDYLGKDIYK